MADETLKYEFIAEDKNLLSTIEKINTALLQMDANATKIGVDVSNNFNKGAQGQKTFQTQTRKTTSALTQQSQALSQIKNQLAGAFSIYAAQAFLKKMVQVRGEFELQSVALSAMLQDRKLADDLFSQVQDLALQSPFKILELNKYLNLHFHYSVQ